LDPFIRQNQAVPAPNPVLGERIVRNGIADRPATSPAATAALTCGLQAQDPQAARLGVRARSGRGTEAEVRHALDVSRTVVKSSLMRGTIHLVAAEDVRWLTALTGPVTARKFQKRWRDLGLPPEVLTRTLAALPAVLAGGPLDRRAIVRGLAEHGVVIDESEQAPIHVLLHATTQGLICRGPDRGRDATFVLLDDWLPDAATGPRGDDALAEIARRYFRAFSPATAADFAMWSGLPATRAVGLIRDELKPVDVQGKAGFALGEVAPRHGLRLLPAFDNYLVGYRDRDLIIARAHLPRVYVGGVIKPTVVLDGRVMGTWRLIRTSLAATVEVTPFDDLTRAAKGAIEAEAADIGRFLELPSTLSLSGR
jgi:hypothetical protein